MSQFMPEDPYGGAPPDLGGAPPEDGGLPPELMALLGGGAGAPAAPSPAEPTAGGPEDEPIDILKQMIELANRYISVERDAEDQATMSKLLATLHQYLAKDQQDAEAALGGGPATRLMRKRL